MLSLFAFSYNSFVLNIDQNSSVVMLLARIFDTTTLATATAYSAYQASKQEKVERYARNIEMEMVAIDPFLETLDDAQKQRVKEEIAHRIFGKTDSMGITSKDEAHNALDRLSSIESLLNVIIKWIKP